MLLHTTTSTNRNSTSTTSSPMDAAQQATRLGVAGIQQTTNRIQTLHYNAPFSFRVLGLAGGLAMIFSNILFLPGRLLTLYHWTNAVISFYCIIFGMLIVLLELEEENSSGPAESQQQQQQHTTVIAAVQEGVRFYAKFLEFTWGRGLLYVFVGTLQVANGNLIDWLVGTFMVLVGTTAGISGIQTAHALRRFRMTIKDERDAKAKFRSYDVGNKGYLTLPELQKWLHDAGFTMSTNQGVSAYLAINKNFDDKLLQDEMVEFWEKPKRGNLGLEKYVV